jgi:metal-responsive CopG/Arc/MetJ family transcriptional regulator
MREEETKRNFGAVSISIGILEEIDKLIEELRYWPSRSAFIREACLEKIRRDRQERDKKLKESRSRGI